MVTYTDPQHVSAPAPQATNPEPTKVLKAIVKRSFATLSTTSPAHRPHVAGVLYEAVGTTMYVNTLGTSRKARNVAANPQVAVAIPIRRLPVGPPSTVHFQGTADVLDVDDPEIRALIVAGHLKSITGHGELDIPDSCFLRISPGCKLITYGLGMSLVSLIRDPLNAGCSVNVEQLRS